MDVSIASKPTSARLQDGRDSRSPSALETVAAEPRLPRRVSLMLVLLLSLGLWASILAVASAVLHWSL